MKEKAYEDLLNRVPEDPDDSYFTYTDYVPVRRKRWNRFVLAYSWLLSWCRFLRGHVVSWLHELIE